MRKLHGLLAPDRAARAPLPESRPLIAQYLLLLSLSGGQDLDALIDPTGRHTRMVIRFRDSSAETVAALADWIDQRAPEVLPAGVSAHSNGVALLTARAAPIIAMTSLRGLALVLALIALLMGLLFRSVRVAVLSIVPNVLPVCIGLLAVEATLPMVDADAMVFLAIGIGIAVDDTIHFLSRYRIERQRGRDRAEASEATIRETGHGILRTSIVLVVGFSVVLASDYTGLQTMGMMLPAIMASAVVLDLTLVPAMAQLGLLEPKSAWRR